MEGSSRLHGLSWSPCPALLSAPHDHQPAMMPFTLPAASRAPPCSAIKGGGSRQQKRKSKRPILSQEDMYSSGEGWRAILECRDEMLNLVGSEVTTKSLQQLQQEKSLSKATGANNIISRSKHKILRVISGKVGRKKLLSPRGMDVRPMMEVVRGAIFDMLQARIAGYRSFSSGRWLDLYSGTGSVGIEALSRGCVEAHFVEIDPWIVSEVLKPNLEATNFSSSSTVHMMTVEAFLKYTVRSGNKLGSFDYISVTPPYESIDYKILLSQLSVSSIFKDNTYMIVEYPSESDVFEKCGPLSKVCIRRYGRTHVAIYGPAGVLQS